MSQDAQTIQIHLPKGDPHGLRIAWITTQTERLFSVPRHLLNDFFNLHEIKKSNGAIAVYFLIKESEEEGILPRLYIGQTSDLIGRLREHDKTKKFWDEAFVMVYFADDVTPTHALFLEWMTIQAAKEAGRYILVNGNKGIYQRLSPSMEADCHKLHKKTVLLLSTIGKRVFEALTKNTRAEGVSTTAEQSEEFYLRQPQYGVEAKGLFTADGFIVLKGSNLRKESVPSFKNISSGRLRQRLIEEGILAAGEDGIYRFTRDYLFKSPSGASDTILGRSTSGWQEWRNEAGKTLDELKR